MTGDFEPSAHPRGTGGRWASKPPADEVDLDLDAGGSSPDSVTVVTASGAELDAYVHHPDWEVRADAAANPLIDDDQATYLADPDTQPQAVRITMASSYRPGCGRRACADPSPSVRMVAAGSYELTAADRALLADDPCLVRLNSILRPAQ